jgi:UDP-N-acetylmuramoyl-tripeptide--D-alanyl-D-alanine ligase
MMPMKEDFRSKVLWFSALRRIRIDHPYIIAVGGGIAKTSTKNAVGAVMRAGFPNQVLVGFGNLNTYLGVPLSILDLRIDFREKKISWQWPFILLAALWRGFFARLPKYIILEYGTDQPKDIETLVKKLPPDMGLLTVVTNAHLANYPSEEAIAEDEGWLLEGLNSKGVAIMNMTDPFLEMHRRRIKARIVEISTPLESIATEYARAVGKYFGIESRIVEDALSTYVRPTHRFNQKKIGNWLVLDDVYNANPASMQAALNLLKKMPGRKVAVLGDMLELGPKEKNFHAEIATRASRAADLVVGVGSLATNYKPTVHFDDSDRAASEIFPYLKDGDSILVKGSRGIQMEKIIEALEKHANH